MYFFGLFFFSEGFFCAMYLHKSFANYIFVDIFLCVEQ